MASQGVPSGTCGCSTNHGAARLSGDPDDDKTAGDDYSDEDDASDARLAADTWAWGPRSQPAHDPPHAPRRGYVARDLELLALGDVFIGSNSEFSRLAQSISATDTIVLCAPPSALPPIRHGRGAHHITAPAEQARRSIWSHCLTDRTRLPTRRRRWRGASCLATGAGSQTRSLRERAAEIWKVRAVRLPFLSHCLSAASRRRADSVKRDDSRGPAGSEHARRGVGSAGPGAAGAHLGACRASCSTVSPDCPAQPWRCEQARHRNGVVPFNKSVPIEAPMWRPLPTSRHRTHDHVEL